MELRENVVRDLNVSNSDVAEYDVALGTEMREHMKPQSKWISRCLPMYTVVRSTMAYMRAMLAVNSTTQLPLS